MEVTPCLCLGPRSASGPCVLHPWWPLEGLPTASWKQQFSGGRDHLYWTLPLHFFFWQSLFPQCYCHPAGYLGSKLLSQWFLAFFEVSDTFEIGLKLWTFSRKRNLWLFPQLWTQNFRGILGSNFHEFFRPCAEVHVDTEKRASLVQRPVRRKRGTQTAEWDHELVYAQLNLNVITAPAESVAPPRLESVR